MAPHSSATDHSRTPHSDPQMQPPSPTTTTYKNRSTLILTPGNEFGFLPPECFTKVEVVRVKRKVLWTFDEEAEGAVGQEQSDKKKEGAILDSNMKDVTECTTADTSREGEHRSEHEEFPERELDQFFIDLPIDHQARMVHPDLRKEALAVFST